MKLKQTVFLLLAVALTATFQSCDGILSDKSFYIDNPTSGAITVTLDETTYEIPADQSKQVDLKPGFHTIKLSDGETVKFNVYYFSPGGIINPTRSLYVFYRMIYEIENKSNLKTFDQVVAIDGIEYEGPISTIADLFIDKNKNNYDYGLRKPFPEEITLSGNQKGSFRTKIFTKEEFIKWWEEGESESFHEANKDPEWVNEATKTDVPQIPTANFSIPEMLTTAEKLTGVMQQFLASGDTDEQKRLYKEYQALNSQLYEASKPLDDFQKYSTDERKYFQYYTNACSNVMTTGIAEIK